VRVQGAPLEHALRRWRPDRAPRELREQVEREVRFANIAIIEGNDASRFGIGEVCARITEAVVRDERVMLPVAAYRERYGVTLALPTVLTRTGAGAEIEPTMSGEEREAFERSVETLRHAGQGIGVGQPV
jgi:L-lactate dehydrogenase